MFYAVLTRFQPYNDGDYSISKWSNFLTNFKFWWRPSRANASLISLLSVKRVIIFYTWHIRGTSNLEKLRNQEITFKLFQVYFFIHRRITLLAILWIRSPSGESSPDGKREIESDAVGAIGRIWPPLAARYPPVGKQEQDHKWINIYTRPALSYC